MIRILFNTLLALILLVWMAGYFLFLTNVLGQAPDHARAAEKTGAIIVLTGGNNRVQTGLDLFSDGLSQQLFITGVNASVKKEDITEIEECCITLGHEATTTLENAYETKQWLRENEIQSIRLVTSPYHMLRALREFNNVISGVEIIPHPVQEKGNKLKDINFWKITFSEYNKTLFRFIIMELEKRG